MSLLNCADVLQRALFVTKEILHTRLIHLNYNRNSADEPQPDAFNTRLKQVKTPQRAYPDNCKEYSADDSKHS